ncbi:MFS transporter [Planosporangium flavigriseum]|uniref:MFS transporter n=1 Tax=Planosporangium flavigriseum TaxID=373681 RepID=A0A8J3LUU8_9ACTN|nr:MFS transporter [Planosporangium flavigriseum]NJC66937.1 MFS transporter [Planosporangium flavigriseum]GIG74001.1 MFS transporter [Planosporangium flavigriseum]
MPVPDHRRPTAFREVLANGEFRAIFAASALSSLGDSMARAAVTALVYQHTKSVLLTGATFAISFLPWLGLGPLLAALAERYPYRRTMVVCDLARMVTIALVAVPDVPLGALLALLFMTALFDPPFRAARSALTPRILEGERYVLGLSLFETTSQLTLILGYFTGGAMAAYSPRMALLLDAATFGISACLVGLGIRYREPALRPDRRSNLLRETAEGFRVVFGAHVLRSIAIVVFASLLFAIVPEGLAAAWAGHLSPDRQAQGWMQGLIMCSMPVGFILGSLLVNRLVGLSTRQRLIRPFGVLAPLALVGALVDPSVYGVALISAVSGFATAALLPAANGLFVQALPNQVRARAFGVMQSGVQLCQAGAVLGIGALANRFHLPLVVGLWGAAGTVLMLLISLAWPRPEALADAIDRARRDNEEGESTATPSEPGRIKG